MRDIYERLLKTFSLGELIEQRPDLAFITVPQAQLQDVLIRLRDREGFTHLVLLTAVDWIEDNQFQLTYLLSNREAAVDLGLRVMIPRDEPVMSSIHIIWPTAATYQRELKEMFGIDFLDSPGIDEPFILEGWSDIPPYRRDFDTKKYAEETYSNRPWRETLDPQEHMKKQLYPDGT
ncbi:NADH-quinone oxidoreductase subunit C [Magnetococcus marinus]|nr:NADH-quinone oxidoreductase subunit C [Magnetococcus marinus]